MQRYMIEYYIINTDYSFCMRRHKPSFYWLVVEVRENLQLVKLEQSWGFDSRN